MQSYTPSFLIFQATDSPSCQHRRCASTHPHLFQNFCEAKISNLQLEVGIQQEVLRLNVSVTNACFMTCLHAIHQLLEIGSSYLLTQSRGIIQDVKQLTAWQVLQNQ